MKKYLIIRLVLAIIILGAGYVLTLGLSEPKTPPTPQAKPVLVASFYPLAHFAEQVVGDYFTVVTITPPDTEPHEYEPTPKQLTEVYNSRIVIGNGGGVDPWLEKIQSSLETSNKQVVIMSKAISASFDPSDPHSWLDPVLAQSEVGVIRDAVMKADPNHATEYEKNAQNYIKQLEDLDTAFAQGLSGCVNRDFVTAHAAFGYLAKRYSLNQIAIAGLSPEEEPSSGALANVTSIIREKKITTIFFETLTSPELAETIARETGAKTAVLNPIEGLTPEDIASGKTYVSIMRDNLKALQEANICN